MKGIWKGFIAGVIVLGVFLYGCHAYLNINDAEFFGDINHAAPILAQVFGVAGLAWMVLFSVLSAESSKVKLIGSGLVLSLAFAANNVWTYGLSIFIVATLVTELQFLEKLAAMFTNRDKYWDYLAQHSTAEQAKQKATLEAIEAVQAEEAEGDVDESRTKPLAPEPSEDNRPGSIEPTPQAGGEPVGGIDKSTSSSQESRSTAGNTVSSRSSSSVESRIQSIMKFHEVALSALKNYTSELSGSQVYSNMHFSAPGVSFGVDAILKTASVDYVVEVKSVITASGALKAKKALDQLVGKYSALIQSAGERKAVKGILIVPKGVWKKSELPLDVVVLELDERFKTLRQVDGDWT